MQLYENSPEGIDKVCSQASETTIVKYQASMHAAVPDISILTIFLKHYAWNKVLFNKLSPLNPTARP
jgi:hypothetical protein